MQSPVQAAPSERARVDRTSRSAIYDRTQIHAILDEGMLCHLGFMDQASPFVIPMLYGRMGDGLVIHGSIASRLILALAGGATACISVTLQDGLVLARSAYAHSMNYRSVVVFGHARVVHEREEKIRALKLLSDQVL